MKSLSNAAAPLSKHLVLVGGGHTHALSLRMLAMNPIAGLDITLVSDTSHTPYSGMLHGLIKGSYSFDDSHIDLRRLANYAGVRFILDSVDGIDPETRRISFPTRAPLSFDVASINIGSTPHPIAGEASLGIKPIPLFLKRLDSFLNEHQQTSASFAVVGGGAGGVELAFALAERFKAENIEPKGHLIHRGERLLESFPERASAKVQVELQRAGIELLLRKEVNQYSEKGLHLGAKETLKADFVVTATGAAPATWLEKSKLAKDKNGFIAVNEKLQSSSHSHIFAAGDTASMLNSPRPKSGVFAVRQAKVLAHNLAASFTAETLKDYRPQEEFLSIISLPQRKALGVRGRHVWQGSHWFSLKDSIDKRFMRKFSELQVMPIQAASAKTFPQRKVADSSFGDLLHDSQMRCLGCAAKLGPAPLYRALDRLRDWATEHGLSEYLPHSSVEDAAILEIDPVATNIQSIDLIPSMLSDPFTFGEIATEHAFSDIFAMGAEAKSAMLISQLPFHADELREEMLFQMLAGSLKRLASFGAKLLGGHSSESETLSLGLSCLGSLPKEESPFSKQGLKVGDQLILTKALGTGVLFAAEMRLETKGRWIDSAISSMLRSNWGASKILRKFSTHALTDVTGFGLLSTIEEMLEGAALNINLDPASFPLLPGAAELLEKNIVSTLDVKNRSSLHLLGDSKLSTKDAILFDPQTSGGLLAAVEASQSKECLEQLQLAGYTDATCIGTVTESSSSKSQVSLLK